MSRWAKVVIAVTTLLLLVVVVAVVFNPLTSIDARFGRGKDVTALAEQIAGGACEEIPLTRSGNETSWLNTCAAIANLLADNTEFSITDRGQTTNRDSLGLADTKTFTYSFAVSDTADRSRILTIVVNEDNRLVEAGIGRRLLIPGEDRGYANRHRYTESYGYTPVESATGAEATRQLSEEVLAASTEADCQQLYQQGASGHLVDTVGEADFTSLCSRLHEATQGAELSYAPVRLVEPAGGGTVIAVTEVAVVAEGIETLRITLGHDLESEQWRLRSLFGEEERLFYRG